MNMPDGKGKIEPNADIRQFSSTMYQMFVGLVDAGFSESQALTIIENVIAASFGASGS